MQRARGQAGFTLLEILVVVFVIGLLYSALAPSTYRRSNLDPATARLVSELRYTAQRARATGVVHRLSIDMDEQRIRIESRTEQEAEPTRLPGSPALLDLTPPQPFGDFEPIPTSQGKWRTLEASDVRIVSVQIGDDTYDDEIAFVGFSGQGGADPAIIQLVDERESIQSVRVIGFTGEVVTIEGEDE